MKDPAAQVPVIDILNDLLDLELSSVFQFLGDSAVYLNRDIAAFRRPLADMTAAGHRRVSELSELINELGGTPIPRGLQAEEQYIAYLSLQFLLPRLVAAKELAIKRWAAALALLAERAPEATALLEMHLAEHRSQAAALRKATSAKPNAE